MNRVLGFNERDFKHGVPPRIFGAETEYTSTNGVVEAIRLAGTRDLAASALYLLADESIRIAPGRSVHDSVAVKTGGEMYIDGEALEFATPECESPEVLVAHKRAGEEMTLSTLNNAYAYISKVFHGNLTSRAGFARTESPRGETIFNEGSLGHHENYLHFNPDTNSRFALYMSDWEEEMRDNPDVSALTTFLALRKLIDGIGMVDKHKYSITQKPRAINFYTYSYGTVHGQKMPFRQHDDRLEIRSGEGSKSDWAAVFTHGLTSSVLRLIEHGEFPKSIELAGCNSTVNDIAYDPHATVKLSNGLEIRAIDALRQIIDSAADLASRYDDTPKYEIQALNDFYQFYEDFQKVSLRDNEVSALADRVDWAARYSFLLRRGHSYGSLNTSNLSAVRDDLKWDILGEADIARKYYRKFGHTASRGDLEILPPNTRAKGRVAIMKYLSSVDQSSISNWDEVRSLKGTRYRLPNPYGVPDALIEHVKLENPTKR